MKMDNFLKMQGRSVARSVEFFIRIFLSPCLFLTPTELWIYMHCNENNYNHDR